VNRSTTIATRTNLQRKIVGGRPFMPCSGDMKSTFFLKREIGRAGNAGIHDNFFVRSCSIRSMKWAARWTDASTSSFVAGGSNPYWLTSRLLRTFPYRTTYFSSSVPDVT
jgi:hypothetical protein